MGVHTTDVNIDLSKGIVVLEFTARTCGSCRRVSKSITALEATYDATFLRIDTEIEKEITGRYSVQTIPTVIVLRDGQEIARKIGSMTVSEFQEFIDSNL